MRIVLLSVFALTAATLELTGCSAPAADPDLGAPTSASGASSDRSSTATSESGKVASTGTPTTDKTTPSEEKDAGAGASTGPRRIFVTSLTFRGDLVGEALGRKLVTGGYASSPVDRAALMLKSADALCSLSAESAALGKGWKAYVGTAAANGVPAQRAVDRLTGQGPWSLVDRTVAFQTRSSFLVGPLVPVNVTEKGQKLAEGAATGVWTGTNGAGDPVDSCDELANDSDRAWGMIGDVAYTNTEWHAHAPWRCNESFHLYCVEEP